MAMINPRTKKVQLKIVYYGPGRAGKTHNFNYIFKNLPKRNKAKIISLETKSDRTLFFDFFPIEVGTLLGYKIQVNFYTIPGQAKYNATRKLVLNGVDGIVFVADSMAVARAKNILSLKNLNENLKGYNRSLFKIPVVFQYNKRDLADQGIPLLSVERLEKDLNLRLKAPSIEASALRGTNVAKTMKKVIRLTLASVRGHLKKKVAAVELKGRSANPVA